MTEYIGTPPSFWSPSRVTSALVVVAYVVAGYLSGGVGTALKAFGFTVIPVACIWFPDELGGYTGMWGTTFISRESPELAIKIIGWVLLLLPVLVVPLSWLVSL